LFIPENLKITANAMVSIMFRVVLKHRTGD